MRIRSCIALLALALVTGCAAGSHGSAAKSADRSTRVIWKVTETPWPIDIVSMAPGDKVSINLSDAAKPGPFTPESMRVLGGDVVLATKAGTGVTLEAVRPSRTIIEVTGKDSGGTARKVHIPVIVEPMPIRDFVFDPKGRKVERVVLAGDFNGWSQDRDPFTKGEDGIFRLKKAMIPGKYNYKLVVDGEWMSDPANPVQDSSGYGNSVLEVTGKGRETFPIHTMSAAMPGAGSQIAFRAELPAGDKLIPSRTAVILNNERLAAADFTVDAETSVISLKAPADKWKAENFVTVFASSEADRSGESLVQAAYSSAPRSPRDEVLYFAMTDRFRDGNPALNKPAANPDLAKIANYAGGDWAGIRQKIEEGYFEKLGVTTIWISPTNKNTDNVERDALPPHRLFTSYHGYWPVSLTETNEQFGSMEDLKALVAAAHQRRIAVLFDYVANHVHQDHPLYTKNPAVAVPLRLPDGTDNIRKFDQHPLTTWFDTFLPDLDYDNNPEILRTMTDNAVWWLKETGADGFRHDAVKHIPTSFWQTTTAKLNSEIVRKEGRRLYQVGETISGPDTINRYIGPDMMDGQFDFPTYWTIQGVLARGTGSMKDLGTAVRNAQKNYPAGSIMSPLLGNHDVSRFMAHADGDLAGDIDNEKEMGFTNPPRVDNPSSYQKLQLAFALLTALPGPPTLYYGDEIGMTGAADPDNRRPMPWEGWSPNENKTFDTVAALNKARHESVALRRGVLRVIHEEDERLVIARIAPEEVVVVTLTRRPRTNTTTVAWPGDWPEPKGITKLSANGQTATASRQGIALKDDNLSFGLWKVEW